MNILKEIDFNEEYIDAAFEAIYELLVNINMRDKADDLYEALPRALESENPFNTHYRTSYERTPTNKVIHIIYDLASDMIREKFPEAKITYKVDGYNSDFDVDEETYAKGDAERWADCE